MKLKTKTVKQIRVNDWDNLVEETYGKPYSFQQQDGCKNRGVELINVPVTNPQDFENDTIPEVINGAKMGVSFKAWLERDPDTPLKCSKKEAIDSNYYWGENDDDLKEWRSNKYHIVTFYERNFYPHVDMIINDLYSKGLIEAGEYQILIDW